MEKWEYMAEFLFADITNPGATAHIQRLYPTWQNPPKYAPQTMLPRLNAWGEQGWELIHMEPVGAVGENQDVGFLHGGEYARTSWSNAYFCVFKRRKE